MADYPQPPKNILKALHEGQVIPAHPLALTPDRKLDEKCQRALSRYYISCGAGGVAVGVHTTQFEIRDFGLLKPVLELTLDSISEYRSSGDDNIIRIAGICGKTKQAVQEARLARDLGYDIGLLSLGALREENTDTLIEHASAVGQEIPLMGFYLQPAVGGCRLDFEFWRRFCQIPNVVGVKIAPFNRYQTLDVVRGIADSARAEEIAIYTGNDDNIVCDLLSAFEIGKDGQSHKLEVVGGLLGHWAFWTKKAVESHSCIKNIKSEGASIPPELLSLAWQITDVNSAVFDPTHNFDGCISGIQEILHRQGLLPSTTCLNPQESLSPGQKEEIDRVCEAYPHLNDNKYVGENLERWL